jgi:hypothetical protein
MTDPTGEWRPFTGDRNRVANRTLRDVPIPPGAAPDPEIDAHMTVIDRERGCEYDFYGAHRRNGGWAAIWANATRTTGTGVYPYGLSSKATGFAGVAGLIWPDELRRGRIDHALFMSYPYTRAGGHVAPATSGDGKTTSSDAIPEGARIQLDPKLDLEDLGLRGYELTVARALQKYGAYIGDTGGAMSLFAVHPQSYGRDPYRGVLPDDPYAYLEKIPVSRFRVLALPAQRPATPLRPVDVGCARFDG